MRDEVIIGGKYFRRENFVEMIVGIGATMGRIATLVLPIPGQCDGSRRTKIVRAGRQVALLPGKSQILCRV